ncbi:hypothetical protein M747DRAFT_13495 [Aspergillus niger ATCC 13496]|uniref:Uncharacterized protein n=1 Tax=Aspergillus niger ATCC 13496 TaxID=1353008 RepID=A0A370C357_ASPNG|nr:hypothetical protein M747DRAFT_13495 [Aspergillus niger ATCC 13496]
MRSSVGLPRCAAMKPFPYGVTSRAFARVPLTSSVHTLFAHLCFLCCGCPILPQSFSSSSIVPEYIHESTKFSHWPHMVEPSYLC